MRSVTLLFTLLAFMFLSSAVFSQWINIPTPVNPYHLQSTPMHLGFPEGIIPVSNNKIMYFGSIQMSASGGGSADGFMLDDFGNGNHIIAVSSNMPGGSAYLELVNSYNSIDISYDEAINGYHQINYTNTGFQAVGHYYFVGGRIPLAVINTDNHFYLLTGSYYGLDTLIFKRFSIGSSVPDAIVGIPNYLANSTNKKMTFINDSVGFFLNCHSSNISNTALLKTVNYGNSWTEIQSDSVNTISNYSFPSNNTGYLVKGAGSIYKTINGGSSWNQLTSPTGTISSINFPNDTLGYVGGPNGVLKKTINGGLSWTNEISGTTAGITNLYAWGPYFAYFTTDANTLFKNQPRGVGINEHPDVLTNVKIYPNPSSGFITIELKKDNTEETTISIKDMLGREAYTVTDKSGSKILSKTIDISDIQQGVYFITVTNSDKSYMQKLILNR